MEVYIQKLQRLLLYILKLRLSLKGILELTRLYKSYPELMKPWD